MADSDRIGQLEFDPVELTDHSGHSHAFHFSARDFGLGIAVDAFELRDGRPAGYRSQVIGEPGSDPFVLRGQLIDKLSHTISIRHLTDGEPGPRISDHGVVCGAIAWDEAKNGRVPMLIIDGNEFTWEAFGRMLMVYEGFQFRLEVRDKSEEF